jgi:hypothetical protein
MKIIKSQIYHNFLHLFGPTILILTNFGPRNPFLVLFLRFDKKQAKMGSKLQFLGQIGQNFHFLVNWLNMFRQMLDKNK